MEPQWWVVLVVMAIIVAGIGYRWSRRTRERNAQDRRISVQAQGGAQSAGEEISQREERRLAGMTTEDRAWEQASLQRHREIQGHTRRTEISAVH